MVTLCNRQNVHDQIDIIFKTLLPLRGMEQRAGQIKLSHDMLDAMLDNKIALCDAGTGIGKTYAYLVAGILFLRWRSAGGMGFLPVTISTSSIALQNAVQNEYLPSLPFPQPNALSERKRSEYPDLHSFIREIIVPEMQLKLKQGFGRAIRTETDTCVVAILDERACAGGRYHDDVLAALPEMKITTSVEDIKAFIQTVKSESYFTEGNQG